jgi:hypothetical protein
MSDKNARDRRELAGLLNGVKSKLADLLSDGTQDFQSYYYATTLAA